MNLSESFISRLKQLAGLKTEEFNAKSFIVTLKHDKGKVRIKTIASDEADAKQKVCNAEGCPESAIVSVKPA